MPNWKMTDQNLTDQNNVRLCHWCRSICTHVPTSLCRHTYFETVIFLPQVYRFVHGCFSMVMSRVHFPRPQKCSSRPWLCVTQKQRHNMRPSNSVSRRHSTVPMCRLPETAHRHSRQSSPGYLEQCAFSLSRCIRRNVQHGTLQGSSWSSFCVTRYIFAKICAKTIFTFHFFYFLAPVIQIFDLFGFGLNCFPSQFTPDADNLSSKFERYMVFCLWQRDAMDKRGQCAVVQLLGGWLGVCLSRSCIVSKRFITRSYLLWNANRKLYRRFRMVSLSMTLSDL